MTSINKKTENSQSKRLFLVPSKGITPLHDDDPLKAFVPLVIRPFVPGLDGHPARVPHLTVVTLITQIYVTSETMIRERNGLGG